MPWQRRPIALTLLGLALDPVRAAGRLRLVAEPEPPYVLPLGHPLGEGIDIDIARAALRQGGGPDFDVQLVPFRRAMAMLEQGAADLTVGLGRTPEREQVLAFSQPYGNEVWYQFLRAATRPARVKGLEDLRDLHIGAVRGHSLPAVLEAALGPRVSRVTSREALLRMASAGHVDLAVMERVTVRWLLQEMGLQAQLRAEPFELRSGGAPHIGFSRRSADAMAALAPMNRGIERLAAGGWSAFEEPYLGPRRAAHRRSSQAD